MAVVAALARPQWILEPVTKTVPTRDLLLGVDLSGSMDTRDFTDLEGRQVDRLAAVKQVLGEFLTRREGDRVGLIVFGSAAFVQAPFTDDLQVIRTLLDEVEVRMAGPKTVVGDAIGLAMTVFERSEVEERVLILLTDGNDTGSLVPPVRAAEIARDKEIVIHTVAVGDSAAAGEKELDTEVLESIARTTGGRYYFAADRQELEQIYAQLDELNPRKIETLSYRPQRDLFHWPLGAGLGLSLVYQAFLMLRLGLRHARRSRPDTAGEEIEAA
jgi:Ca-activated chloride channel family protein